MLPNIKSLHIDPTELKYWFSNNSINEYLHSFLQRLDRLYIGCSSIININLNEELIQPLLSFIINKNYFPQLKSLRFIECKCISSSWCNLNKSIDFILDHVNEHQLICLRFDFIEKEDKLTDLTTGNQLITIDEPPCIVDIHRLILDNHIAFWIERKWK